MHQPQGLRHHLERRARDRQHPESARRSPWSSRSPRCRRRLEHLTNSSSVVEVNQLPTGGPTPPDTQRRSKSGLKKNVTQADPAATTHSLTKLQRIPSCAPSPLSQRKRSPNAGPTHELTNAVACRASPAPTTSTCPPSSSSPPASSTAPIEVRISAVSTAEGPAERPAFAGIAYRVAADGDHFEAECCCSAPEQTSKESPPSPRQPHFTIQYFAYPDWKFDRLREQYPGTRTTKAARTSAPTMMHAQAGHRRHPADRDRQWSRNSGTERNRGCTRSRRPRPVRRHRQRILLLQPQDHAALSGSGRSCPAAILRNRNGESDPVAAIRRLPPNGVDRVTGFDHLVERGCVSSQWRRAVMIQARELNQTPSSLRCAESVSRRRPTARDAAAGSSRFRISLVQVKPRTQSRAAATSGP